MISPEHLTAFAVFAVIAAGTPGPNNMMTLAVAVLPIPLADV
jgi:threonine/homoserine/homoserine lactone efflux protein